MSNAVLLYPFVMLGNKNDNSIAGDMPAMELVSMLNTCLNKANLGEIAFVLTRLLFAGLNTGVLIMDLKKMREFGWLRLILSITEKYYKILTFGDQDVIRLVLFFYPGKKP